ncbi:MAG: beta-lactamase family protein [Oscillospiraceae bacterium]|jgi:CubicO group peptidase (beta-lactamase class C family)|nr:beta-lactamase family protein [Oscillospiraceae bacterium]
MPDFKHLDALLQDFIQNGLPGCGCAVAKDGKVLYEGYHGFADIETARPVGPDTVYRLFSMTKVVICTAAMMLYERGKFLLSDPLYAYIPEYRKSTVALTKPNGSVELVAAKKPMLVRDAFTMAVGLPHPMGESYTARAMAKVREELAGKHGKFDLETDTKAMAGVPIAFEPGSHFLYGYGHDLVARLIEVVSGKTVGAFLKDEIFAPLAMKSTGYRYFGDIRERMISLYEKADNGSWLKIPGMQDDLHEPDAIFERGGAGLFSTVSDYLVFTQMLANGGMYKKERIIGRKTIDLMRQNQLGEQQLRDFAGVYNAGYGYGLGVRTMLDRAAGGANNSSGEFGWTGALGTWTAIDPAEGVSVVYMHQTKPNMEEYHHLRVRAAAFGGLD